MYSTLFLRSSDRVSADEFCAHSLPRYNVRIPPPADHRSNNLNSGGHDIHLHLYIIKIYESGILLLDEIFVYIFIFPGVLSVIFRNRSHINMGKTVNQYQSILLTNFQLPNYLPKYFKLLKYSIDGKEGVVIKK